MLILMINLAYAQEEIRNKISKDSIFWGLDRAMERIQIAMAGTPEEKIVLRLKFANERLAEINDMNLKNKPNEALKAEEKRQNIIKDIEAESSLLPVDKQEAVLSHLQKHIEILNTVKENAPEQAQAGLNNALENSNKVIIRLQERINNKQ